MSKEINVMKNLEDKRLKECFDYVFYNGSDDSRDIIMSMVERLATEEKQKIKKMRKLVKYETSVNWSLEENINWSIVPARTLLVRRGLYGGYMVVFFHSYQECQYYVYSKEKFGKVLWHNYSDYGGNNSFDWVGNHNLMFLYKEDYDKYKKQEVKL